MHDEEVGTSASAHALCLRGYSPFSSSQPLMQGLCENYYQTFVVDYSMNPDSRESSTAVAGPCTLTSPVGSH